LFLSLEVFEVYKTTAIYCSERAEPATINTFGGLAGIYASSYSSQDAGRNAINEQDPLRSPAHQYARPGASLEPCCPGLPLIVHPVLLSSTAQAASNPPSVTYIGRGSSPDPNDNVTVSLNIPNNDNSSLFFHFSAPAGQTWAAFGLGGQMAGTLMFVTYASQEGNNVTVSPRLGKGHVMPQHTNDVQVQVLEGSGIKNGTFVVNAKCTNCRTWDGGSLKTTSTSQPMIWAAGSAGELNTNDLNANIQQHQGYEHFSLDLTKASGVGGVPVVDASTSTISSGSDIEGTEHWGASGFHAFLMVAAFLIGFPGGYLLLRVFEKVWLHWGVQSAGLVLILLGMGVGIAISKRDHIVSVERTSNV
jgi:hypothetical protein